MGNYSRDRDYLQSINLYYGGSLLENSQIVHAIFKGTFSIDAMIQTEWAEVSGDNF